MSILKTDLTNCDREPIHILGKIQSHGFLIAIVTGSFKIKYISNNIDQFLPHQSNEILGSHFNTISHLFKEDNNVLPIYTLVEKAIAAKSIDNLNLQKYNISGTIYYAIISLIDDLLILEFEPVTITKDITDTLFNATSHILSPDNENEILINAVNEIKNLIGYDRVMAYEFLSDGTGKVSAEAKEDYIAPWLNLHYPESDIPKQARELYKINRIRLIADVESEDVALSSYQTEAPLNLTHCSLRAVSPIHIQYLKNMKVASSFSLSIVIDDKLWGLIACHNYSPKYIDYRIRIATRLLAKITSSALRIKQTEIAKLRETKFKNVLLQLQNQLSAAGSIANALTNYPTNLLHLTYAQGAALILDDQITLLGITPGVEQIKKISIWAMHHIKGQLFHSSNCIANFPFAEEFQDKAAGVLISILNKGLKEMIIWFKPQRIQTVNWAGKPEKKITTHIFGTRTIQEISPRKSFETWTELVKNYSEEWQPEEIKSAEKITQIIVETAHKKSSELNILHSKLKSAYEELDSFAYTVSHDLKNPLAVIKTYADFLIYSNAFKEEKGKDISLKISKGASKMSLMIEDILKLTKISVAEIALEKVVMQQMIQEIVAENKMAHKADNTQVIIENTPDITADPTLLYQVFSNLIGNAIKYSSKVDTPVVNISGYHCGNNLIYRIVDNGIGIDAKYHDMVFDIFKRMDNANSFEGTGVGLTIVKKIMNKLDGKIWVISTLNEGCTFYLIFNNQP